MSSLLEGLNPDQKEAVLHTGSPLLILAGAGSGKTRVITVKIAWMIQELGYHPASILALTFTNKAAKEMQERAAQLDPLAGEVMIRTFHSFGAWFLRRNADVAGLDRNFSIYDDDDSLTLLSTLYPGRNRQMLSSYAHLISRMKDKALGPEADPRLLREMPDLPEVYQAYQDKLRQTGNCDFGDLILLPLQVLKREEAVARRFHDRFQVILVDEYQDSNLAQYEMLKALAGSRTQIGVVGDDDQSIYRFRGAEVRNILEFPQTFPDTKVIKLERNYRSTNPILQLADAVVSHNENRLGKSMWTEKEGGDVPKLYLFGDQDQELDTIISLLRGTRLEGTAILYRTNAQSRAFETGFLHAGIPYRIVGSVRFYEREEVKDTLALLRLLANPRDEIAFRRMVNKPSRGVGPAALEKLLAGLAGHAGQVVECARASARSLAKKAASGVVVFLECYDGLVAGLASAQAASGRDREGLGGFVEEVINSFGLKELYEQEDRITGTQKLQNLEELVNAASLFAADLEGLVSFLETVELDSSHSAEEDSLEKVTLITMHNTKGLEFDRVIISGLEDEIFPRNPENEDDLEEERRLFYVALTRAREELILTACSWRRVHGRMKPLGPSRFVKEIPRGLVEVLDRGWIKGGAKSYPEQTGGGSRGAGAAWSEDDADGFSGLASGKSGATEWFKGCPVYHDDYGPGFVGKAWIEGSDEVVMVEFESGRKARFIPKYSSLEKLTR